MLLLACSSEAPAAGAGGSSAQPPGSDASAPGAKQAGSEGGPAGDSRDGGVSQEPSGVCAHGSATTMPMTPTVWLIVDGSSSMNAEFEPGTSRWQALRSTLLDPGGVVASLDSSVRFGMVIYSGGDLNSCVNLITVDPALDNHATLEASYPRDPLGPGTPTDKAIERVVMNLPVLNRDLPGVMREPVFVVLATDGTPTDSCVDDSGLSVEQRVVDVVARGSSAGMRMFVISLAGGAPQLQTHLDEVAKATGTGKPPFVPSTREDLVAVFETIVTGGSCRIGLSAKVAKGTECAGTVLLGDQPLACDSDNGYRLLDERTIQLTGEACSQFLAKPGRVDATFECLIPQ